MAECSTSDLIAQACISQFTCLDKKMQRAVMLQLLCNISAGEGATTFNNLNGSGSPVGAATPDYIGQFYVDTVAPYGVWFSVGLLNTNWIQMY